MISVYTKIHDIPRNNKGGTHPRSILLNAILPSVNNCDNRDKDDISHPNIGEISRYMHLNLNSTLPMIKDNHTMEDGGCLVIALAGAMLFL